MPQGDIDMTKYLLHHTVFTFALVSVFGPSFCPADEDLGFGYVRRGGHIHFIGGGKTGSGPDGTRIDRPSQENIDGFSPALPKPRKICKSPDASSFEALSERYTRDKNMVYYKWISPGRFLVIELPDADVKTFEVIGFNLARDKKQVWWYGFVLPGLDAATVKLVSDGFVWKDAQSVWYQSKRIVGADPKTFRHLGSGYYIDAKRAYWGSDPIDGADLATFKVLGDSFIAVDRNMVYRSGQRLPHVDPGTCKFILHNPYGYQVISDKNGVYLNKLKFLHADPNDFRMIDQLTGRGGEYVFLVDTYQSTPVTVYREGGRLVTETVLYEKGTANPLAIVKAEVSGGKLENITFSPAPGKAAASPVPDWQIKIFQRPGLIKRMKAAGELLK